MKGIAITLRLVEPVLATGIEGDPNSSVSLPFVQGSQLRGALIERFRRGRLDGQMDAAGEEERRLFFSGRTCFLNAYPLVETGALSALRALPAPLAWRAEKRDGATAFDLSVEHIALEQSEPVRGLLAVEGSTAYPAAPDWQVTVHTQRDARKGRPVEGSGAVFRYQSIPAGARLQAIILCESAADLALIESLLAQDDLLLGGARTAGYGRACVEAIEHLPDGWREAGSNDLAAPVETQEYDQFVLRCLSETLLRDEAGQYTLDPLPALRENLGAELRLARQIPEDPASPALAFCKSQLVGGFNRKAGLPTPQVAALARGSVFIVQAGRPISGQALLNLEARGIGERRAEGYGRIALFALEPEDYEDERPAARPPAEISLVKVEQKLPGISDRAAAQAVRDMDDATRAFSSLVLRRLLERKLEHALRTAINSAQLDGNKRPSNHALSRWRTLLHDCLPGRDLTRLRSFLQTEQDKGSAAWRDFERTRIRFYGQKRRLSDWIRSALETPEAVWDWMGSIPAVELGFGEDKLFAAPTAEDTKHYCLRLLDGVLAKLAHQAGGKE